MIRLRDRTRATRRGLERSAIAAIAAIAILGGGRTAAAQDVHAFQLEGYDGFVELGFLSDLENRSRSSSSDSDFDRVEMSQRLNVNTWGYIYHPRFLTFQGGLDLEGIEGLAGQSKNRVLVGGNWRFNLLERHPNSLSIFGRVLEAQYARPFAETYDITSQTYGATFFQKWGWLPFDLTYKYRSESGGVDHELDDSANELIFRSNYQIGEKSDGGLDYNLTFEKVQDRNVRRQDLVATNVTFLGDGNDKRLYSNLLLHEEINGRRLRSATGSTSLDWRHTEKLWTRYVMNGRWSDNQSQKLTSLNPAFFLNHQLYASLRTSLEIFGHFEDASYRSRSQFGSRLTEDYNKRLGEWGRLNINVSPHATLTRDRPDAAFASVFDEAHVLFDLVPVQLEQTGIIETTIVVTNEDQTIVYDPGVLGDYVVNPIAGGAQFEIVRTPVSDIADGERVLVSYDFELPGDSDLLSTGVGVYSSLWVFDQVAVFGRYDTFDYHVLSGDREDLQLNEFDRYVVGMEFSGPWYSGKAEYEDYDATLGPFWGYSGSVSFFTYGTESWRARLNADYSHRDHTDSGETVNRMALSASASTRFLTRGLMEFEGAWVRGRWSGESSDANDVDSLLLNTTFTWSYGKFEVKLETGFAQILRPVEDNRVYRADLRVRRVF